MIGRGFRRAKPTIDNDQTIEAQGFDAYEIVLGDMMRGERATLGKSLLDIQRELKIKAAYIAAIENADPSVFDTPGFIAGYVRSYARYLNMDPEWAFEMFCRESGFQTAHGMSSDASSLKPRSDRIDTPMGRDIFSASATPFIPAGESFLSKIEPRAIGSIVVLLALISGLGYGGYSVLQEVQRVQFAPVEQAPTVLAEVDPLAGGGRANGGAQDAQNLPQLALPSAEALDRLYRPNALETPVLTRRDGPISSINSSPLDIFDGDIADTGPVVADATVEPQPTTSDTTVDQILAEIVDLPVAAPVVQVTETPAASVTIVAARSAWVRVRSADGTTIFESVMEAGDTFDVPQTEVPPVMRIGESGAIYFAVNGTHYGPAGARGQVTSNLALSVDGLRDQFEVADMNRDSDLAEIVRFASVEQPASDPQE